MSEILQPPSDLIEAAIYWAERSIPVFPCNSRKAPLTKNGFKDAESDPAKVRALFEFYGPAAKMIGGRMGDGIFAVDVDLYKSDEVKAWYKARLDEDALVDTRVHKTKSGGVHLLYSAKDTPSCVPAPGIDVKGDGGYIILPGTPGYTVISEGMAKAPLRLLELLKYSVSAQAGSTIAKLEANILSAADFHNSLNQLAAKLASKGDGQAEIQTKLRKLLEASTASTPGHDRHARWRKIMEDAGGELSRIVGSAYRKFNDDAVVDEMAELQGGAAEFPEMDMPEGLFSPTPETLDDLIREEKIQDEVWPFKDGYWGHEEHNLAEQEFTMYPIFAENESVVIYAEPKTGKTAIALTTALCISCGFDYGNFKVSQAGPTLYYALEGTRAIRLRVAAWRKKKKEEGVKVPDVIPMYVVEGHTNFLKEDRRKNEANKIISANRFSIKNGAGALKAVYLDTLTKAMSGGDQNSVEDTSSLFDLIGILRAGGVTATIIFVHHKSRTGNARGSTNIEAEPDVLLDITKQGDVVKLRIARARSIEDGGTFHFTLMGVDLGKTAQGHPLAGVYAQAIMEKTEEEGEVMEIGIAKRMGERRKIITQLGKKVGIAEVIKAWFDAGLIEGKMVRKVSIMPNVDSTIAKEALATVANEVGGTIYGDYVIRPITVNKKLDHFAISVMVY